jgi:CHAT domain
LVHVEELYLERVEFNFTGPSHLLYFVLFAAGVDETYDPIVQDVQAAIAQTATRPNGFDDDMIPALPGLWFALHLPRNVIDTVDATASAMFEGRRYSHSYNILLVPTGLVHDTSFTRPYQTSRPTLILAPDERLESAQVLAAAVQPHLGIVPYSDFSPATAQRLWQGIAGLYAVQSRPRRVAAIPLTPNDGSHVTALPDLFVARQLGWTDEYLAKSRGTPRDAITASRELHAFVAAVASLEAQEVPEAEALKRLRTVHVEKFLTHKPHVTVAFAGAAPSHRRRMLVAGRDATDDLRNEQLALNCAVAHHAASSTAIGVMFDPIPPDLFAFYGELERRYSTPGLRDPHPSFAWRTMKHIGARVAALIGPEGVELLQRAARITAFTDFPVGLAILPGDTAPLACQKPITYRPLTPLTRTLQQELAIDYTHDLTDGVRVLIAEALQDGDRIKPASLAGWVAIRRNFAQSASCTIDFIEVDSEDALQSQLERQRYDILILSSHGSYDIRSNSAELMLGGRPSHLTTLGSIPPLVILSACHVAPRGFGAVTVADMLIRAGATAVLGTLIPVKVHRNAQLVNRFLLYVIEALEGRIPLRTIADVWQHVCASHAVHEIAGATRRLHEWFLSEQNGVTVDAEFKNNRSAGRLRLAHVYDDTRKILEEIAAERGALELVRNTLDSQSFLPESAFYTLLGRPERLVLNDPLVRRLGARRR